MIHLAFTHQLQSITSGHGEANKRSIDSKCGATAGIYPALNRPIVGQSLVSILGSGEIFYQDRQKRSRLSSLINILNRHTSAGFSPSQ